MLAALLKWPQATFASKVEIDQEAKKARVTREVCCMLVPTAQHISTVLDAASLC